MHALMGARGLERLVVSAYHHVTERQRRGPTWQKRQIRQYPRERGSVRFEDAINDMDLRTPETR